MQDITTEDKNLLSLCTIIPCPRHNPQKRRLNLTQKKKRSLKLRLRQSKLIRSDPNPQPKRRRLNLRKQTISQAATSAVGLVRSNPIRSSPKPTKMKIEDYNKTKDLTSCNFSSRVELILLPSSSHPSSSFSSSSAKHISSHMGTDQNPDQTKPPSSFVVISRISDPTSASGKLPSFGKNLPTQDVSSCIILPSP